MLFLKIDALPFWKLGQNADVGAEIAPLRATYMRHVAYRPD